MSYPHVESLPEVPDREVGVRRWTLAAESGESVERNQLGVTRMEPGSETDRLTHEIPEFVMMLSGELLVTVDDVEQRIEPGHFLTVPAGASHSYRNVSETPARMLFAFAGELNPEYP